MTTDYTPPADRAALRDRIAEALLDHLSRTADIRPARNGELAFMPEVTEAEQARMVDAVLAVLPPPVSRAGVLREAADALDNSERLRDLTDDHMLDINAAADELRRMADEAQPATETLAIREPDPVCEGFVWIGQPFTSCDRCSRPAWEHDGEEVAAEDAGPFDTRRTVRPWAPGQADAIRAKWEQPAAEAQQDGAQP